MHIVLGASGHVGSAVARSLLKHGEAVTVVTRDAARCIDLKNAGAEIAVADVRDITGLRNVLLAGKRAFLLNPPAAPSSDTDVEERATVAAIVEALEGSGLEKVVAASAIGARPGQRCGDLTVLHEFEEKLKAQPIPAAINRGAYYMSNWMSSLDTVKNEGKLPSFFAAEMMLPMVDPADLGEAAARRMLEPVDSTEIRHVEGPQRYNAGDVARALAAALQRDVQVATVPREKWLETFIGLGFSEAAAHSYACMTASVVDEQSPTLENLERGRTTLNEYVAAHVQATDNT